MQQTVTIWMAIPDDADAGDAVNVYWDALSGTIDYAAPVNAKPIELFPGQLRAQGYGSHPYGVGCHDGRARRDRYCGYGYQSYGVDPYGNPPPKFPLRFEVPNVCGVAQFGVRVQGPGGDYVGDPYEVAMFLSPDPPPGVLRSTLDEYDVANDQVVVTWTDAE